MTKPRRILVIQLQQLGDALLTAALLEDVREAFPSATIDYLTRPLCADLLDGNPFASNILRYDVQRKLRMMQDARARQYDTVFDLQSIDVTAALALWTGAKERFGWKKGLRALAYTHQVPRSHGAEYVVRYRQRMLEHASIAVRPRLPRIYLTSAELATAAQKVNALRGGGAARRVALVLSARAPGSIWPVERYAALAEQLAADGYAPVVLPTAGDDHLVTQCLQLAPNAQRADFATLREFVAGLAAFDALICGSTGPSHMALAVGTPAITLFGADDASTWSAGLATTIAVSSPRAKCDACQRRVSRLAPTHTCMLEISVEEVAERARRLLPSQRDDARLVSNYN